MNGPALPSALVICAITACGPVRPELDLQRDAGTDATEAADSSGVRLLSDVRVPVEPDTAKAPSSGHALDASSRASRADGSADVAPDAPEDRPVAQCGNRVVEADEECDDGPANTDLGRCLVTCRINRCEDGGECYCGDGMVRIAVEECDDANHDPFDGCSNHCKAAADHLLITEVVTRPSHAEMIEIMNPTKGTVSLSAYGISDSHLYYKVANGTFATSSGTDFAAFFPEGATIEPGQYRVVSLANSWGGSVSFASAYGKRADFELRPAANGAVDDPSVPNMRAAQLAPSIGANASLTDGGEPIVLFYYAGGSLVSDVDYLFYGAPSTSNPVVDKTAITSGDSAYRSDRPAEETIGAPAETGSIHRCAFSETGEVRAGGNGLTGHDETSEDSSVTFALGKIVSERTPGAGPPPSVCRQ